MYQQRGQTTKNGCRWKYMNVLTSHQKDAQNVCNSTIVFGPLNPTYSPEYGQFSLSLGKTLTFSLNSTLEYGH